MIDWSRVRELREEIGAEDFDEVVALFLSEVEDRLEMLRNGRSTTEIGDDLHFLKGSALNLGFTDFATLCHEGEASIGAGEMLQSTQAIQAIYDTSKTTFLDNLAQQVMA